MPFAVNASNSRVCSRWTSHYVGSRVFMLQLTHTFKRYPFAFRLARLRLHTATSTRACNVQRPSAITDARCTKSAFAATAECHAIGHTCTDFRPIVPEVFVYTCAEMGATMSALFS